MATLDERMKAIAERDKCRPECRDNCASCTPDGFWAEIASDQLDVALKEVERLQAQRDYYRRRWIIHGIRWPQYFGWPGNALSTLSEARAQDAPKDAV